MHSRWFMAGALVGALGCGSDTDDPKIEIRDVRIAAPVAAANMIDLLSPEMTIQPGDEKMTCKFINYTGEDVAVKALNGTQGEGGHHILILTTSNPRPDGTVEDCTDRTAMADMRPLILPIELPPGHAVRLRKGVQFVLQTHYVNTFAEPILARDVARLETMPDAEVEHWVAPFATNDALFDIKPKQEVEKTFDCKVDRDGLELMLVGGHMHENGTVFDFLVGTSSAALESIYYVDPWRTEFRDSPPVKKVFQAPIALPRGTVIRTTCKWKNGTDKELEFPHEMCASFGYVRGTDESWVCDTGGIIGPT